MLPCCPSESHAHCHDPQPWVQTLLSTYYQLVLSFICLEAHLPNQPVNSLGAGMCFIVFPEGFPSGP